MSAQSVRFVFDADVTPRCCLPVHPERHGVAWSLIEAYALRRCGATAESPDDRLQAATQTIGTEVITSSTGVIASNTDAVLQAIERFHDSDYVSYLQTRETRSGVDVRSPLVFHGADSAVPSRKRRRNDDASSPFASPSEPVVAEILLPLLEDENYGLSGDCPPYMGMWYTAFETVRGTIAAVESVIPPADADVSNKIHQGASESGTSAAVVVSNPAASVASVSWCAFHWWGGRHHAMRDGASGFCYLNDVVIGVQTFQVLKTAVAKGRQRKPRVLVIDIDAHHGDGTQEAFYHDATVTTFSTHGYGRGVFPGSGRRNENGKGTFGRGSCINVPLPVGCAGRAALKVVLPKIRELLGINITRFDPVEDGNGTTWYDQMPSSSSGRLERVLNGDLEKRFDGVFLVCGADSLQGDPLGNLNFTIGDVQRLCREVMSVCAFTNTPLVVLGAGGYDDASFAKMSAAVSRDAVDLTAWLHPRQREHSPASQPRPFSATLLHPPSTSATSLDDCADGEVVPIPLEAITCGSKFAKTNYAMNTLPPAVVPRVTTFDEATIDASDQSDTESDASR